MKFLQKENLMDFINKIPKETYPYIVEAYNKYSDNTDWIWKKDIESWTEIFLLPLFIQNLMGEEEFENIEFSYFEKLWEFFRDNYTSEKYFLKLDLFSKIMYEKTKKYFSLKNDSVINPWKYDSICGLEWGNIIINEGDVVNKSDVAFDLINIFIITFLEKAIYMKYITMFCILQVLDEHNYDVPDELLFSELEKKLSAMLTN